ncbi:MAG: RpiB/LacA/LacB family sugar-phosphate isomerase [Dysgonamonadaceae bacterium]|jgi:ribose 5-phosphate isomerase B|nr:RpiB/LacA/LacB family sugar-phosphate isomerase [Dysgonamonadaceae bacterium]MDD3356259.1 RpiB/LacA/LacB family sugar-phosphate isomerase [Dysgonamonadaceae bacterium]MDD3728020.1 RpiB/LacA/LacB family sugar-phosphate isomerase [Dysgonamonadaceae bacterium]MDD4245677.1 RpiB/LacA/LacB family sugar-phosphate isomerase [Dysgonamonadaceae bacterium]MDD4605152.1 RpiB/LacA/LacB family sugar-phosphate isomerase [Dysgonamonadaceae bacterium]
MKTENKSLFGESVKPIGLAGDHAGFPAKDFIITKLKEKGIPYIDFGTYTTESSDYSDFGHQLAKAVEAGECYPGIAICGSGNGVNMTVNKHQGIRAALCWNKEIAQLARAHNDANILSLPGRFLEEEEIYEILVTFLNTPFEGGRHKRRIDKIPCE